MKRLNLLLENIIKSIISIAIVFSISLVFVILIINMNNKKLIATEDQPKNEQTQIAKSEDAKNISSRSSSEIRKSNDLNEEEQTESVKTENNEELSEQKETDKVEDNEVKENNKEEANEKEEIKESKEEEKIEDEGISIKDVKISKTMDLSVRTGLSKENFKKLMAGVKADTSGFFEENAETIYDLCKTYSINEIFFCGLISAESGWNIASNHRSTHNYISLMKNGKLISYSSVYEGLKIAAEKLHTNYLTKGGKFYHGATLAGVKTCFCPSSTWVDLVYGRMKQIIY